MQNKSGSMDGIEHSGNTEIDLWELIGNGYRFFKKRKVVILTFFGAGILFGISNLFTHPLEYQSFFRKDFIAGTSVVSNEILGEIINNIPLNRENKNVQVNDIGFPGFRNIKSKVEANNNNETRLKVTIEVFDSSAVDSVLTSLTAYLNSIRDLSEKFSFQWKQEQQLLSVLTLQMTSPDTSGKQSGHQKNVELFEKKQELEKKIFFEKIVNFIPVYPVPVLVSNSREGVLNVLGFGFLGIVLGFITGYLLNFVRRK
ncbi:MAG: hypothetical protein NT126_08205 [Bacteroidetes bacterium]|nr:hypothetical protein [Bacteroidota bacterium]